MGKERPSSRRTVLRVAGLGTTATAIDRLSTLFGRSRAAAHSVNIVDAGAQRDGSEFIDDVLSSVAADNTTVEFPPGTYKLRTFRPGPLSNFTLSGTDATLVPPAGSTDIVVGLLGQHVTLEGFTFDYSAENTAPQVIVRCSHGLTIQNCRFVGVADVWGGEGTSNHEYHLMPAVTHPDGNGLIRNVSLAAGSVSPSNRGGIWVSGESAGTLRFEHVHLEQWANNSLYIDESDGSVVVSGSRFVNNAVSGPRIASSNARVVDTEILSNGPVPRQGFTGDQKSRGLWIDDHPDTVRVEDCRIVMTGPSASDALVFEDWAEGGLHGTVVDGVSRADRRTHITLRDSQIVLRPDLDVVRRASRGATVIKRNVTVERRG